MTTPVAGRVTIAAVFLAVACTGCLSGGSEARARDSTALESEAEDRAPGAPPEEASGATPATGVVTVTTATPSAGDGVVRARRRIPLALPGAALAFSIEGESGPLQHAFLVVVDSGGTVKVITHRWNNADNSVVAQTGCGARTPCPAAQVRVDQGSGAVTFTNLVLTGLDGNTADPATSTLTGTVR
ncbi:MAG: hypothetical protein IT355_06205 [Gemmatimonadaceae bacterium]|nr:hypothetical protein [Gemmatimonadaceae bacterium]